MGNQMTEQTQTRRPQLVLTLVRWFTDNEDMPLTWLLEEAMKMLLRDNVSVMAAKSIRREAMADYIRSKK